MKITHGLMDGQVLQRDEEGRAAALIVGNCRADGKVELRIRKNGKVVSGFAWREAGLSVDKYFHADLEGLKCGGPYSIELRIRKGRKTLEQCEVSDLYVGDVWILAGQSNMEGVGNLEHAPKPNSKVRAFYMRDEWGVAEEPMHMLSEAVDAVHNEYGAGPGRPSRKALEKIRSNQVKGMSPGHAFALEMLKRTKVPQGLIACAHGGTSMAQWSPELKEQGGKSLYGAMMRRYEKLGQPVAGLLWYQGESDANLEASEVYTERMKELVAATRSDMGLPKLPWLVVQLGCHAATEDDAGWNSVQEQQRLLSDVVERLDVASAIDLELDDGIHIGGKGQQVLGGRLARIADRLVHKAKGAKPGIRVKSLELVPTPGANPEATCSSIKITYSNVVGKLISDGRPSGFTLVSDRGEDLRGIFKTILKGNSVILCTTQGAETLPSVNVSYGYGRFPMCNITDAEGMSIPGMQALPVWQDHMPWVEGWKVARLPGVKSVSAVSLARIKAARGWKNAPAREGFGVLPKEPKSDAIGAYAFKTTVRATEALSGRLLFGVNAPFKLWLNGKLILGDPKCTMPIFNPRYAIDIDLKRGLNTLHVAFVTDNPGAHIGICARAGTVDEKADDRIHVG